MSADNTEPVSVVSEAQSRPNLQSRRISYDSSKPPRDLSLGILPSVLAQQPLATGQRSVPAREPANTFAHTVPSDAGISSATDKTSGGPWNGTDNAIWQDGQVGAHDLPRSASFANTLDLRRSIDTGATSPSLARQANGYDPASAFPSAVSAPSPRRERMPTSGGGINDIDALSAGFRNMRVVNSPQQGTWQPPPAATIPRPAPAPYSPEPPYMAYYNQGQPDLVAAAAAATAQGAGPYYDAFNWQPAVAQGSPTLYQQQNPNHLRRAQSAWQIAAGMPAAGLGIERAPSRSPVQSYSPTMGRPGYYAGQEPYGQMMNYDRNLAAAGFVSPYGFAGQLPMLPGQQIGGQRIYRSPLLEEFRSNRHRRWELEDIRGSICEFASDQLGSRHIQTKLETASPDERAMVFAEILPNLLSLCTDTFGNYVCQKLFEVADREQKVALVDAFRGNVLRLSLQSYACRVVQKAIEQVTLDQQVQLVNELDGHVLKCARDQNANHTLQKIISCMPSEKIGFIADACLGQVFALATHPYGCRVLQRILENMRNIQPLIDELIKYAQNLIQDQYGNYLAQHLLEHGPPAARSAVIARVRGQIFNLCRHKFASNVIDKAILCSTEEERRLLTAEILDDPNAVGMMLRDPFANYPLQKFLLTVQGSQRDILLQRTAEALENLKRFSPTYSKHLMAIEKWVLNAPPPAV